MWMLMNRTPWSAERNWVRDRDGNHCWIVAVKATFTIRSDGSLEPAEQQRAPCLAPVYWGQDGSSSLRYECDLGPLKPATDVLVSGYAYAPGHPVKELDVVLRVAGREKIVRVRGDSVFRGGPFGMAMTDPQPFLKMPIVYERAFGGTDRSAADPSEHRQDPRNPIGVGFATKERHLRNRPAPNIMHPHRPVMVGPAGFGPIASYWAPRMDFAGTYDSDWQRERMPLLPLDYDERFILCAPQDQQWPGYLQGGEPVELTHMTPDAHLRFVLPRLSLQFTTYFGQRKQEHRARLVTVQIEPDDRTVVTVWQTAIRVEEPDLDYLDATLIDQGCSGC